MGRRATEEEKELLFIHLEKPRKSKNVLEKPRKFSRQKNLESDWNEPRILTKISLKHLKISPVTKVAGHSD